MAGGARGAARAWDRVEGVRLARRAVDHRGIGLRLLHDDHEHGAFDLETIADLAGWFQATNVWDCFNSGGHAAMAISRDESLADWNFCPNSEPNLQLYTAHRT